MNFFTNAQADSRWGTVENQKRIRRSTRVGVRRRACSTTDRWVGCLSPKPIFGALLLNFSEEQVGRGDGAAPAMRQYGRLRDSRGVTSLGQQRLTMLHQTSSVWLLLFFFLSWWGATEGIICRSRDGPWMQVTGSKNRRIRQVVSQHCHNVPLHSE